MSFTAYAELRLPQVAEAFTHLGFPTYFRVRALVGQAPRRGVATYACRRGSRSGHTPALPSISLRRSLLTSREGMAQKRGLGCGHQRAMGTLILLLAPPGGHADKRLTASSAV